MHCLIQERNCIRVDFFRGWVAGNLQRRNGNTDVTLYHEEKARLKLGCFGN